MLQQPFSDREVTLALELTRVLMVLWEQSHDTSFKPLVFTLLSGMKGKLFLVFCASLTYKNLGLTDTPRHNFKHRTAQCFCLARPDGVTYV